MEIHDLKRMFDQLAPTAEQEEAVLDRLLEPERKVVPMKKLKKLTAAAIAAALMLVTCAAAVVTGLDQRLLDYFGAGPEQAELLLPGAVEVNESHTYDNGWTVKYGQVLADRWCVAVLVDVTAPEEVTLEENGNFFNLSCDHLDAGGEPIRGDWSASMGWIEDDDPADNHATMLWQFSKTLGNMEPYTGGYARFTLRDMERLDGTKVVEFEDWPCTVKLPDTDSGILCDMGQPLSIEGLRLELSTMYVSPLKLVLILHGGEDDLFSDMELLQNKTSWSFTVEDDVILNLKDGTKIPASRSEGFTAKMRTEDTPSEGIFPFQWSQPADPAQVVSVTLFGQTYELR